MKTCPACGFHHSDLDTRCLRCNASLDASADPETEKFLASRAKGPLLRPGLTARFDPLLIWGNVVRRFQRMIGWTRSALPDDVYYRKPWVAASLSLIPGAGQLYNHQAKKALLFIVVWFAAGALAIATFFQPYSNLIIGPTIFWMAYVFHDGLKTAITINRQTWNLRISMAMYLAWVFEFAVLCLILQAGLSMFFVKLRYIKTDALQPTISRRDRIAIDILSYRFRSPRLGEIVFYKPMNITLESGEQVEPYFNKHGIERIVAGPGQTFELRDGKYYRDGIEAPVDQYPLSTYWPSIWDGRLSARFKLTAPPGHYVILYSYVGESIELLFGAQTTTRHRREASVVAEEDIKGRVWFVYNPPGRRRVFRPPASLTGRQEAAR